MVFASRSLLPDAGADRSLEQVANVATLPGIVEASYAMPDVHWGYGFPIGGVAATDVDGRRGGLARRGRLRHLLRGAAARRRPGPRPSCGRRLDALMDGLGAAIPRGMGRGAVWQLPDRAELDAGAARRLPVRGRAGLRRRSATWTAARTAARSPTPTRRRSASGPCERGARQVGSLGSGNHFLEVQAVEEVYDEAAASAFGLRAGQVCVMIHCGSRGLGHQICTDHVRAMEQAMARLRHRRARPAAGLRPGRLAARGGPTWARWPPPPTTPGPTGSCSPRRPGGSSSGSPGGGLDLVYDVSHNLAKIETHEVDGAPRRLCVHRKGATRALPPGHPDLPDDLRGVGQPVLIPGSMGTASYVLAGRAGRAGVRLHLPRGRPGAEPPAGRAGGARARTCGASWRPQDIAVRGASRRGLAEETPEAYKDVTAVVDAAEGAGLCRRVARLVPLGVVKG